jgi:two-component sensor histidine kinase
VRAAGGVESAVGQSRVMGFLFDIHAHKFAEEHALRASLKEKDLLLREIHHRVKNNLQVVSSLLRLQAATHQDPAIQRALQEAQERIHAIALIHQKLKHAPDFSQLDLPEYVRTLAERLVRSYASQPALIDLQVQVANVEIGPDAPVPLGLILNELVANALQHAFPPGEGGSLEIGIDRDAKGWITLRVADSGQGLPESVDLDKGGLGFQLVRALADQLGGVLELERRRGASFLLRFPSPTRQP